MKLGPAATRMTSTAGQAEDVGKTAPISNEPMVMQDGRHTRLETAAETGATYQESPRTERGKQLPVDRVRETGPVVEETRQMTVGEMQLVQEVDKEDGQALVSRAGQERPANADPPGAGQVVSTLVPAPRDSLRPGGASATDSQAVDTLSSPQEILDPGSAIHRSEQLSEGWAPVTELIGTETELGGCDKGESGGQPAALDLTQAGCMDGTTSMVHA